VLASLIGRRQLDNGFVGDFQFPLLTFLQFVFYMGWLKVGGPRSSVVSRPICQSVYLLLPTGV